MITQNQNWQKPGHLWASHTTPSWGGGRVRDEKETVSQKQTNKQTNSIIRGGRSRRRRWRRAATVRTTGRTGCPSSRWCRPNWSRPRAIAAAGAGGRCSRWTTSPPSKWPSSQPPSSPSEKPPPPPASEATPAAAASSSSSSSFSSFSSPSSPTSPTLSSPSSQPPVAAARKRRPSTTKSDSDWSTRSSVALNSYIR